MVPQLPFPHSIQQDLNQHFAKRIRIKEDWKFDILRSCTNLGYNRMTLFRDLDSISAFVQDEIITYEKSELAATSSSTEGNH